ncbi:MAG: hypothetical protein CMQ05_00830 [Gammaproteobacteria bacterium]|uniref:Tetratricopeptide repeat protein n=1 Tax=OM182 bacterium MED-G24 TaxID=1986255 RepID=A0A2A5WIL1_9GAMM|nr:hypothetical protein [Gammaproteobacteria bacterium]PDH36329.1 MAG: hypothetical protein CNE99_09875 [OM182 bacterium MED-G24]RPG25632.1 MAG: hypothetical protein CBC10_006795 [Gammaproteobacteria bacterium TMED50]|tara:strand:+ start:18096 stop:19448 length:1353 start_codon:yes stop_codon:yes gene_type:complete
MRKLVRNTAIALFLVVAATHPTSPVVPQASAAKEKEQDKRRVMPVTEVINRRLMEARVLIDPASELEEGEDESLLPDPDPRGAIELLNRIKDRKSLNPSERANVHYLLAFAYYSLEDIPNAVKSYEMILAQSPGIKIRFELTVLRSLYQIQMAEENFREALDYMDRWETLNLAPDLNLQFARSNAWFQLKNYRESLKYALLLEEMAIEQGKPVKELWWYVQVLDYTELKDIDNVIKVLEKLIVHYPKKRYWMHLAAMYSEKEMESQALSTYYAAYTQGLLEKESEYVMLAQRLLSAEVPFEASQILDEGFKEEIIEENEKNIKLLAMAYTMAQEHTKAIDAWSDATRFAEDGMIFYRLAHALQSEDRHREAVKAYDDALDAGGMDDESEIHFWKGNSLLQLNDYDAAIAAFRESRKGDNRTRRRTADQYIKYIRSEKQRIAALEEMTAGL